MSQDIAVLAAAITTTLAPSIPYLMKASEAAASEISKKTVDALWNLFKPKAAATPALAEAIADVERNPADQDSLTVLRVQIRKVLEADPSLVASVRPLVENSPTTSTQTVIGDGNITAGRDITGNVINRPSP